MTEEQIKNEIQSLLEAITGAIIEHNFYLNQRIRVLQELNEIQNGILQLPKTDELSDEELYKRYHHIQGEQIKIKAANEIIASIKKLELHAKRRHEEKTKKLEKFCKQHGLNPDLYIPKR